MKEDRLPAEWLLGVVLGAAAAIPSSKLISLGVHTGAEEDEYEIFGSAPDGSPLVQTEMYKLFVTRLPSGQFGLLKMAKDAEKNDILKAEESLLERLQEIADQIDEESLKPLNYGAMFPKAIESFETPDGRFAMFLGWHPVIESFKQLSPLSLLTKDVRVDLKTAVWILGKQLRFLDFLHRQGDVTLGFVDPSNTLLETDLHGVIYFDFSQAKEFPSEEECRAEVAEAASMVWIAVGGTEESDPPFDSEIMNEEQYWDFVSFIKDLMEKGAEARTAHEEIYHLANLIWPPKLKSEGRVTVTKRDFHPFTTYKR